MRKSRNRQFKDKISEVHESDTCCPSIEKALFKERSKLQQILAQNQLKKIGLQKAQALIKILYEEVNRLQVENFSSKAQLQEMFRQYSSKQTKLKRRISYLEKQLRDMDQRQFQESNEMLQNCMLPDSSRKLSVPKSYNSASKKNYGVESPIKKEGIFETVSKQYIEYGFQRNAQLYEKTKLILMSNQIENILIDFEDMGHLVRQQKDQLNCYKQQYIESQITADEFSNTYASKPKSQKRYSTIQKGHSNQIGEKCKAKKLFSTQISNQIKDQKQSPIRIRLFPCGEDRIKEDNHHDLNLRKTIKEYQDVIQQYKEYSAYLKAYLCSCIGFISKQAQELQHNNLLPFQQNDRVSKLQQSDCVSTDRSNNLVNFPTAKIFPVVLRDVLSIVGQKIELGQDAKRQLEKQNAQLKSILDQLVYNIKKSGFTEQLFGSHNTNRANDHQDMKHQQIGRKEKSKLKNQKTSRNKDIHNPNKDTHRMTLTETSNYYQRRK